MKKIITTTQEDTLDEAALAERIKATVDHAIDRIMPTEDEIARMSPPEIDKLLSMIIFPPRVRISNRTTTRQFK